jgi:hypothetical protein
MSTTHNFEERPARQTRPLSAGTRTPPRGEAADGDEDEEMPETLPPGLRARYDPATRLVLGRVHTMGMYIVMKAKHRYAAQQNERLLEELRVVRAQLKVEKDEKELMLDDLLRGCFGCVCSRFLFAHSCSSSFCTARKPSTSSSRCPSLPACSTPSSPSRSRTTRRRI